jgi:FkbM family methyltransferase
MLTNPEWFTSFYHKDEGQYLYAVKVGDITSFNDGDVCNAAVVDRVLSSAVDPPICVDIGVDKGWWSTFCLTRSSTAEVYAFEPNPVSVKELEQTFSTQPRFHLIPKAVSNTDDGIPFVVDGPQSNSRDGTTPFRVHSTRLDFLFDTHPRVHLMKIDTEGHEWAILNAIAPHLPKIDCLIFEFTPRWYGASEGAAVENSISMLELVMKEYPYIYTLSRRGLPILHQIESEDEIYPFVLHNIQYQTDIVCSRVPIELPPFTAPFLAPQDPPTKIGS